MTSHRFSPRAAALFLVAAGLTLGAGVLFADSTGITGRAQSANGCNCHGTIAPGVTVTIAGPQSVAVGTVSSYTVTVSGGAATTAGGFDLHASGGTLHAGTNDRVSGTDVTHSNPNERTWTFTWTAPATAGAISFYAAGVAANDDGDTGGDAWNFYGGVVNTAFPITVTNTTGVGPVAALTWLAPPAPNPVTSGTRLSFSLAQGGAVRLEMLDAAGRRVAMLEDGELPAGVQNFAWNGRMDGGSRVPAGVYFVRLTTSDARLSRRVMVVH